MLASWIPVGARYETKRRKAVQRKDGGGVEERRDATQA